MAFSTLSSIHSNVKTNKKNVIQNIITTVALLNPTNETFTGFSAMGISSNGSRIAFVDNANKVYVSHNYGANFTQKASVDQTPAFEIFISNDGSYVMTYGGGNTTVFISTNGGTTWDRSRTMTGSYMLSCACFMSETGQYMGYSSAINSGTSWGTWISSDYGANWVRKRFVENGPGSGCISQDGKYIFINQNNNALPTNIYSNNYGESFSVTGSFGKNLEGGNHISGDGKVLVKSSWTAADVYISINSGVSFTKLPSAVTSAIGVNGNCDTNFYINYDGSVIYCISATKIFKSIDKLQTISQLTSTVVSSNKNIVGSKYGKYLLTFGTDRLYLTSQSNITEL
jgi:hypothetical protein